MWGHLLHFNSLKSSDYSCKFSYISELYGYVLSVYLPLACVLEVNFILLSAWIQLCLSSVYLTSFSVKILKYLAAEIELYLGSACFLTLKIYSANYFLSILITKQLQ